MPTSKAQQRATATYKKKTYDETKILLKKGEKEKIKAHAEQRGESLNGFINRAIRETIQKDQSE